MVSDLDLVTRLREILRSSDLDTATPASVRRQLEADFDFDLTDRKGFIRDQIDAFLDSNGEAEDKPDIPKAEEDTNADEITQPEAEIEGGDEEGDDEGGSESDEEKEERPVKAKKRGGGFSKICQLSPQLEKFLGTSQLGRTEVVKKMWVYIKEKDLQDPKDRRKILCDESLNSLFRVKTINMFQMNKALAKHIWPLDANGCASNVKEEDEDEEDASEGKYEKGEQNEEVEDNNEEESENEEVRTLRKRKRKKPAKSADKPKRKGGGGGFTKVCSLSPELQAFTGVTELARTEVVKMLWSYIKEKNLQDPKDKRTIICDESLRTLFPFDSINMFQMNKLLTKHIWPLEDNAGGSASPKSPKNGKQKMESDDGGSDSDGPKEKDKKQKLDSDGGSDSDESKEKDEKQKKEVPLPLSDALVKFLGDGERSLFKEDVVKRVWEYIKENDLQDPSEKKRIICDEKLKELFEVDSFEEESVSELLSNHLIKTEE